MSESDTPDGRSHAERTQFRGLDHAVPDDAHWFRATCAAGAETWLLDEVRDAGGKSARASKGSVSFHADWTVALRLALWSRLAQRIALRLGETQCDGERDLYEAAYRVPWEEWFDRRSTLAVHASGTTRALRHTHFVGQRVKDAVCDRLRAERGGRPDVDRDAPTYRILAHVSEGRAWLGLDISDQPLFQRGYRVDQGEAPLKETLAAAILRAGRWAVDEPLVDPMCGSGTFCIEAAWMALGHPPGFNHKPSPLAWPPLAVSLRAEWNQLRAAAAEARLPRCPAAIRASDIDRRAVEVSRRNARQAGVEHEIDFRVADVTTAPFPQGPGLVVANPPYGQRLDEVRAGQRALDDLRKRLEKEPGFRAIVIVPESEMPQEGESIVTTVYNGPIPCHLLEMGA